MENEIIFFSRNIKPKENQIIYLANSEKPNRYSRGKYKDDKFWADSSDYEIICFYWLPANLIIQYSKQQKL